MDIISFITAKPVLIGLHLGFAILGIDAFLWLLGEYIANAESTRRRVWAAVLGCIGFAVSWIVGGYYYVTYYGALVKPIILKGTAPWAHAIAMEAKEHIFLFMVPLALTALFIAMLDRPTLEQSGLKKPAMGLVALLPVLGLTIGLMGYVISAAARWGIV